MKKEFFPKKPHFSPTIYGYTDTQYPNMLKIGYTARDVKKRVAEQYPTKRPGETPYRIVLEESAMKNDGTAFDDHAVHAWLKHSGFANIAGEWFTCTVSDVQAALLAIKTGDITISDAQKRTLSFAMRPEQKEAVEKTASYFSSYTAENPDKIPHFLWNAKMRFGKTFASYQLAKTMDWNRILVLTFKPAVQAAWEEDLATHRDFSGWQFVSNKGKNTGECLLEVDHLDKTKPIVCFGSFQDFLGKNSAGGIKAKNEWVHTINWDCVIFDEYHYGSWRENAKELFEKNTEDMDELNEQKQIQDEEGYETIPFSEDVIPITTRHYLYLSGTPFRAINSGEFIEEQIFNWTYSDEQKAKTEWTNKSSGVKGANNPYESLPRMVLLTYQLPPSVREVALQGEFNEFNLNTFFSADGQKESAHFIYENEVQKWLDIIRGSSLETTVDNLKLGAQKPPMPYADARLLEILTHAFWFLPSVASCYAMVNLLKKRQNTFYHSYAIIIAAGTAAGIGVEALKPVYSAMQNPLQTKTITLSCGKLTTGVSVKPWTGIFMLRNSSSPETYFQAAFRVQTPWTIKNPDGLSPNTEQIIKEECYIFDFAPDRALRQIADYSCRLNIDETNPEQKVAEFINFLPILAYDGSTMRPIDAAGILDMAMSGTTATLLARRWESALLVNVDNATLQRLINNKDALNALMSIEGFRNLNQDIETIINKSNAVKNLQKKANDTPLELPEKKQLSEAEKEYKSLRKQIQEKLIKFATRIPVFMYLTDYREKTLKEVITQLEPALFKKVTGLHVTDFERLVSLNVFNSALMNDAVYKFKRYEDSSLSYTGIITHQNEKIGLYDTVISKEDIQRM